jgi:hypothetical protein
MGQDPTTAPPPAARPRLVSLDDATVVLCPDCDALQTLEATGARPSRGARCFRCGARVWRGPGGIAFETPPRVGPLAPSASLSPDDAFQVFVSRDAAFRGAISSLDDYRLVFARSLRGLASGAPVELFGWEVGEVWEVEVELDGTTGDRGPSSSSTSVPTASRCAPPVAWRSRRRPRRPSSRACVACSPAW